jgi:hypothetical protein
MRMKFKYQSAVASLVVANAAGWFYVGYKTAKRSLEQSYQDMLDADIADMREHYKKMSEDDMVQIIGIRGQYEAANDRAIAASEALAAYQQGSSEQIEVVQSIEIAKEDQRTALELQAGAGLLAREDFGFNPMHPDNQLDAPELEIPRNRTYVDRSKPYIISVEDFMLNEKEFTQRTLTYYQGDDTLTEDDEVIEDSVRLKLVGTHLSDFGQMSNDPNAVYIRNLPLKQDLEIVRGFGKYSVEVAGLGDHE